MNIKYVIGDYDYSFDSIKLFFDYEEPERIVETLLFFYPELKEVESEILSEKYNSKRYDEVLRTIYEISKDEIEEKQKAFQAYWDENRVEIQEKLERIFNIELDDKFNDIIGTINLNPVMPRFLDEKRFDIFYLFDEKAALASSLHELIHFIWFDVWNRHFNDDKKEYETPHLKWIFSEMVVDVIRDNSGLKKLDPFKHSTYEEFYDIKIENQNLMYIINEIYLNSNSIEEFMEKGYEFCEDYRSEIEHIR